MSRPAWMRSLGITVALLGILAAPVYSAQARTLKLAIGDEPTEGFDPMLGWSHGSYLLLHSPLLKQNEDLSWSSFLLSDYQTGEDGKTWTLTLKPGLKFSDGSALEAKDVAYTYNNAAASGGKVDMGNFLKAEAVDPMTVRIALKAAQSTFVNVLGSLGIVSADQYDAKTYAQKPIGAGPYRLVSYQPGQQLIVEANPYYAGHKNDFPRLVFVFLDEDSAFAAAQSKQLGIVRIAPALAVTPAHGMKLWVRPSVENRGIVLPTTASGKKDAQGYPIGNDVTADVAIRKAINYAINRQLLADQVLEGHAIPAFTGVEGLPWNNPDAAFKDGDSAKAKQILEDAGWVETPTGVREKNGLPAKVTLWYASGDATRRDLARPCAPCSSRSVLLWICNPVVGKPLNATCTPTRRCLAGAASTRWSFTTTTAARPQAWSTTTPAITAIRWSINTCSKHWMRPTGSRRCRSGNRWSGTAKPASGSKGMLPGRGCLMCNTRIWPMNASI